MVALRHAIDVPHPRRSYVLAGAQVKPARWPGRLLRLAPTPVRWFMQLRSGRRFDPRKVRSITDLYATLDLREELPRVRGEVVIVVGGLDRPHRGPAQEILDRTPRSRAVQLRGGGHETNKSVPGQLADQIAQASYGPHQD